MLQRIGLGAVFIVALLAFSLAGLWFAMTPPRLPVPAQAVAVIKDVTLVNPGLDRAQHVDIAISGGVIRAIGPTTAGSKPGDIRCPGCTALPGLMDMHAHLPPRALVGNPELFSLLFLANGVTTIREMGSADGGAYAIRDAIATGRFPGPRVISCGRVLDGDPPTRPNNVLIRTPAEGRAEVRKAVAHRARCIKLYNMVRREVVLAVADEAAKAGVPIVAHTPHSVSLLDAPYLADIQHLTGVPETSDVKKLGRDDYINADFAHLTDARIAAVTAAALRQHTIHTPALINEESRRTLGDPVRYPPDPQIAVLPDFWSVAWRQIWAPPNVGPDHAIYEGFLRRDRDAVQTFLSSGVAVYAGTDTLMPFVAPGSSLKSEVKDFAGLGLTPEQALSHATTLPGRFWKDRTYGRIAVGLPADIVLYRRDPTASLDALETLQTVIADGRVYPRATLDAWVERYRRHFHGKLYGRVMAVVTQILKSQYKP
jgi:imidazolonepropionase-like amidohydrolase